MHIYIYTYMYKYICIYTYTHTHTHSHTQQLRADGIITDVRYRYVYWFPISEC